VRMDARWFQAMEKLGYSPRFSDGTDAAPSRRDSRVRIMCSSFANCSGWIPPPLPRHLAHPQEGKAITEIDMGYRLLLKKLKRQYSV